MYDENLTNKNEVNLNNFNSVNDVNIVVRFFKELSSGNKEKDLNMGDRYSDTSNASIIGTILANYKGIVSVYNATPNSNGTNDLILEYNSNKKKVVAVGENYNSQATKLLDSIYMTEVMIIPEEFQEKELIARQVVQLANVYKGTLANLSKEDYFKQIDSIYKELGSAETRKNIFSFLKNVIDDSNTSVMNKKWAMQIHNKMTVRFNYFNKSVEYKNAISGVLGTTTPFEYSSMVIEMVTEAKENNINIDILDLCKKNNIDISTGMVNDRALFVAVSEEFQRSMIEHEKKAQSANILETLLKI